MWYQCNTVVKSLSARRAWIEIIKICHGDLLNLVALRKESVDRNKLTYAPVSGNVTVALRKESVDRNLFVNAHIVHIAVALRKESVDRNSSPNTNRINFDGRYPQ